jgi:hypothetical protein
MAYDKFIIAPINSGLRKDVKPFLIPDDAFAKLRNAYVFRGRVKKRFGSDITGYGAPTGREQLNSRLAMMLQAGGGGNLLTDADGCVKDTVLGTTFRAGQLFSIGTRLFTVTTAGVDQQMLRTDGDGDSYNLPGGAGVGITDGAGAAAGAVIAPRFVVGALGSKFVIGADTFEVVIPNGALSHISGAGLGTGTFDTATGNYVFLGCEINTQIVYYPKTALFDTTTGNFTITGAPINTQVYFYRSEPVMGIAQYETGALADQPTYAFDTRYAYIYAGGRWLQFGPTGNRFHGTDSNFFWSTTWRGITNDLSAFFTTNFNYNLAAPGTGDDSIWTYNGTTWSEFRPKVRLPGIGHRIESARIIIPFKGRLILLNTIECNEDRTASLHYKNRCRFSRNGTPFNTDPVTHAPTDGAGAAVGVVAGASGRVGQQFRIGAVTFTVTSNLAGPQTMLRTPAGGAVHTFDVTTGAYNFTGEALATDVIFYPDNYAWLEQNQPGAQGAGYIDAPTTEAIVSAQMVKDRLIVYFEESTWELVSRGNFSQPFEWQQLNSELGSRSTFSSVPFDRVSLTTSVNGFTACNGVNVQRIDQSIPDQVFQLSFENSGTERIHAIRDFFTQMVYWTVPTTSRNATQRYPDAVICYNYENKTWAINDDCFTCFGYFEQQGGKTWGTVGLKWEDCNFSWDSGMVAQQFRQLFAGNHQGFVLNVSSDLSTNASAMQITDINTIAGDIVLTIVDNNVRIGDYIKLSDLGEYYLFEDFENIDVVDALGDAAGILSDDLRNSSLIGARFIVGSQVFTIDSIGLAPLSTSGTGTGTFNTVTGDYTFTGCTPGATISFLPYSDDIYEVQDVTQDTVSIGPVFSVGEYLGGGTVERVSEMEITTKEFNPYLDRGKNVYIAQVDFYVKRTPSGQITVDYAPSSTSLSMVDESIGTASNLGNNTLDTCAYADSPFELYQEQLWRTLYFMTDGQTIQLSFGLSHDQMKRYAYSSSDFELDAIVLHTLPVGRL